MNSLIAITIVSLFPTLIYSGIALGYIIGCKIYDFYYTRVILPKIRKQIHKEMLASMEIACIIGHPNNIKEVSNG